MPFSNSVTILEQIEPGMLSFDENMNITSVNRLFLKQFPLYGPDEVIGKNILDIHKGKSVEKIHSLIKQLQTSQRQVVAHIKVDSSMNFEKYYLLRLMNLITGSNLQNYCLVSYDITDSISNKHHRLLRMPAYIGNDVYFVALDEILYFVADNIYTKFCTKEDSYYAFLMISEIEEKLPVESFARIHRSYIVNVNEIEKITKKGSGHSVIMKGTEAELPISRSRAKDFFQIMGLK